MSRRVLAIAGEASALARRRLARVCGRIRKCAAERAQPDRDSPNIWWSSEPAGSSGRTERSSATAFVGMRHRPVLAFRVAIGVRRNAGGLTLVPDGAEFDRGRLTRNCGCRLCCCPERLFGAGGSWRRPYWEPPRTALLTVRRLPLTLTPGRVYRRPVESVSAHIASAAVATTAAVERFGGTVEMSAVGWRAPISMQKFRGSTALTGSCCSYDASRSQPGGFATKSPSGDVMRWLLLTVVLALAGGGLWIVNVSGAHHGIVHAVTTPAPASGPGLSSADIGRRQLPGPPTKPGCYRYAPARGWRRVKCDTKQYIRKHIPHPEMISGDAVKLSTPARPFTDTDVMVALRNVGPETDTQHGADNYSIQDNVIFHDSNGQLVAVQFTDQASPFGALEAWFSQVYTQNICVWSVNVTTQNYDSTFYHCLAVYLFGEGIHARQRYAGDGSVIRRRRLSCRGCDRRIRPRGGSLEERHWNNPRVWQRLRGRSSLAMWLRRRLRWLVPVAWQRTRLFCCSDFLRVPPSRN